MKMRRFVVWAVILVLCAVVPMTVFAKEAKEEKSTKISAIKVTGNKPVPVSEILGQMQTKVGSSFSMEQLNKDIQAIQKYYREKGYIAFVTEQVGLNRQTGVLTIPILVQETGKVEITGLTKTKPETLLKLMDTKTGKVFNIKVLQKDMSRIYTEGHLKDIKPPKITPAQAKGQVNITIPVVEE